MKLSTLKENLLALSIAVVLAFGAVFLINNKNLKANIL